MKIKVDMQPIAKANFDMVLFKKSFLKGGDFKDNILKSTRVIKVRDEYTEEKDNVSDFIFYSTDWSNLFYFHSRNEVDNIVLSLYRCEVEGFRTYIPVSMNARTGIMNMKEKDVDFTEFVVTHSLNKRFDKHIEFMLSQRLIDYVNHYWKQVIELEQDVGDRK